MDNISLGTLFWALGGMLVLSALFSSSETALMSVNRYRLRNMADKGHRGAKRALALLETPDRLIAVILLGNNLVNILASSLTTVIALRLGGEEAIAIGAGLLTLAILIFAEVTPKTLAALNPERVALPAAFIMRPLLLVSYPLVWVVNQIARALLRMLGQSTESGSMDALSREELRTVVAEAGALIPDRHQSMLVQLLDLEKMAVEDIMIPRPELFTLDISQPQDMLLGQMRNLPYSRVPVHEGDLDNIIGVLVSRSLLDSAVAGEISAERLREHLHEPYFTPKGTTLYAQLQRFQADKRRSALVVDEYGDIIGLVTLVDVLQEIVGEFASDPASLEQDVHEQDDGSYLIDGLTSVRLLNRSLDWELPENGPKTLSGLLIDYLETIPSPGTALKMGDYLIEILQMQGNIIKTVRIERIDQQ